MSLLLGIPKSYVEDIEVVVKLLRTGPYVVSNFLQSKSNRASASNTLEILIDAEGP